MTEPDPTPTPEPDPVLEALVAAAGDADAVRLSALVWDDVAAGTETFTRDGLVAAWSVRWRRHLTGPASRQPYARVRRSLPVVFGVDGLRDGAEPEAYVAGNLGVVAFLAERVRLADDLDRRSPTSNVLPVGNLTEDLARAVLYPQPPPPDDPPPDDPPVDPAPARMAVTTVSPLSGTRDAADADA